MYILRVESSAAVLFLFFCLVFFSLFFVLVCIFFFSFYFSKDVILGFPNDQKPAPSLS